MQGVDPRGWDSVRLFAAFETALRQSCKDEAEWRRMYARLTAEPKEVRDERRRAAAAGAPRTGMTVESAEALMARFAASDAMYGAG